MPSPDLSTLVDLAVWDRTATDLEARALAAMATLLPGLTLPQGTLERAMLQAECDVAAENGYAINRLLGGVVEILARTDGVERSSGVQASASVTFVLSDALGHTVPAGTRLRLPLGTDTIYVFTTDADLVVAAGQTTGVANVTAVAYSAAPNGTVVGTPLEVVDPIVFVQSAALATAVAGGADPEDSPTWYARWATARQGGRSTLGPAADFAKRALTNPAVNRATAIDLWDSTAAGGAGATATGHVTVAVLGPSGALLSAGVKAAILADLTPRAMAGLQIHVINPTITNVPVTATVHSLSGFADADVKQNVVDAVKAYLNPDTWPWAGTVRLNEVVSLIDNAPGVDFVDTGTVLLNGVAADRTLTGVAPLATTNIAVGDVTVIAPT